ncbi:MAG: ATP-dependent RecD-like DNA helicase [Bacillota bacterium]
MDSCELVGVIKHIVYQSPDESFVVAKFKANDETLSIVGPLVGIKREQEVRIWGHRKNHSRYGEQIQVSRFEISLPSTVQQIIEYLSSSVKNIGKKRAEAIVAKLGEDCLKTIIEEGAASLQGIKGISDKKAAELYQYLLKNFELQYVLSALFPQGLTVNLALKAYRAWGFNAIHLVQENPYLLSDLTGIGFFKADLIAKNMGFADNTPYRRRAAIKHLLLEGENQGHCFLPKEVLLRNLKQLLKENDEQIIAQYEEELEVLLANRELIAEGECIYLYRLHQEEERVAQKVRELIFPKPFATTERIRQCLDLFEIETGLELAPEQKQAIETLFQTGLCILTGGPGTGKTLTVNGVISVLRKIDQDAKVLLASPTGRASQNLAEITGEAAGTIHRLLGFRPGEISEYNEDENLDCDLLVIDEVSMLDISLAAMLFEALNPIKTRVLFVGDSDQLPSVGPGNVLQDLIEAGVKTIRLKHIFRQAETSQIITNAHRVNKGEMLQLKKGKDDFYFLEQEEPENIAELIKAVSLKIIEMGYSIKELQVLSPMHRGSLGTKALNNLLQGTLNPPGPQLIQTQVGETVYREGDRVMQLKNNYDKGVFNGDVGFISEIIPAKQKEDQPLTIIVEIRGEFVDYSYEEAFDELSLAYCMTVHKAQGGEVPVIIMPVSNQHYYMLARNLLYTGITRAKEKVILIGTKNALARAIANNKTAQRYTGLAERLQKAFFEQ